MKKGLLKKSVVLGALMLSAGAIAAELEVSMFYPADMATRSDVDIASEVVGFYHNLEWSNALMAEKGANLVLKPTKVSAITDGIFSDPMAGVVAMKTDMADTTFGQSVTATDYGHIAMGLGNIQGGVYGRAQAFIYSHYQTPTLGTRKIAITHGATMSPNATDENIRILLHEVLHTMGASHNAGEAALFDSSNGYDFGYATTCDNGIESIMAASTTGNFNEVNIAGANDCKGDNYADMVTFINTFAPKKQTHATTTSNQTVTLDVTENITNETYEFIATRSNVSASETMTMYIAGGKGDNANPNSLIPMAVNFDLGSETSAPISVSFSAIHSLFERAHSSYQSTYAVVIGADEVQDALVDLLDINTQWSYDDNPDDTDDTSSDTGTGNGGSLGFIALGFLALMGWRRRV